MIELIKKLQLVSLYKNLYLASLEVRGNDSRSTNHAIKSHKIRSWFYSWKKTSK